MDNHEPTIQTPLTETFQRLKEQALETGLLYVMDIEALEKLAELNLLQQRADSLDEFAPEQMRMTGPFTHRYTWLHVLNRYFIHRDEKSTLWRLGTELSKRGGGY